MIGKLCPTWHGIGYRERQNTFFTMTLAKSLNFCAAPILAEAIQNIRARREAYALKRARQMREQAHKLMWLMRLRARLDEERAQ